MREKRKEEGEPCEGSRGMVVFFSFHASYFPCGRFGFSQHLGARPGCSVLEKSETDYQRTKDRGRVVAILGEDRDGDELVRWNSKIRKAIQAALHDERHKIRRKIRLELAEKTQVEDKTSIKDKSNALPTVQSIEEPSLDPEGEFVLQPEIEPADKPQVIIDPVIAAALMGIANAQLGMQQALALAGLMGQANQPAPLVATFDPNVGRGH
ncbi:Uncharacterized protein APZ42_033526 [Daphnia magna]|uniref:Uncharacterized protein n=1 Tax=Daphnia magna TaxID=35525 RepID=A0A164L038_9CRUS|nr:Uncharacterized protein APZ42_033526 [Daphnia magna]